MNVDRDTEPASAIAQVPLWYHTIEVAPGVVTPGYFDLRPIVDQLPWPDVQGKRCLDVGTWDGFLAFELERRGAAEVVAVDIPDHEEWDMPPRIRAGGVEYLKTAVGPEKGLGFRVAREVLGSSVVSKEVSVYDLSPERLGHFDVVVCGSLLLHLRDPLRALDAIRSVCTGSFLSTNQVDLTRSIVQRKRPLLRLDGLSDLCQWFLPNAAAHRRTVEAAGFDIERESGLYSIPFGVAHPPEQRSTFDVSGHIWSGGRRAARHIFTGNNGVPHHALLAKPAQILQ